MYHIVRMEYYKKFDTEDEEKMLENARLLFVGQTPEDLFDWTWLDKSW
ncbi:5'-3' exonuclease [Escherichia phage myPSH2311]|nr:5'-3' exonuclease [Escherichia phage myPSH2311]